MTAVKMRQSDGGYVLVYVVVVIVILCILVPAACSNSLQNLKAQQASIERMQQLYTAEGQIEQFVAEMLQRKPSGRVEDISKAEEAAQKAFSDQLVSIAGDISVVFTSPEDDKWNQLPCKVKTEAANINIVIVAQIKANLTIVTETHYKFNEKGEKVVDYYSYKINGCTITYESYEISTTTAGEGENQP